MTCGEYRKCLNKQMHMVSGTPAELQGYIYQCSDPERMTSFIICFTGTCDSGGRGEACVARGSMHGRGACVAGQGAVHGSEECVAGDAWQGCDLNSSVRGRVSSSR